MILFGVSPQEARAYRSKIAKQARGHLMFFMGLIVLPFVIYALFATGVIPSKSRFNQDLEIPVALVQTAQGMGSAFLYDETALLTARHLVEDLKEGEEVTLIFQNHDPAITTQAKVAWKDPDATPDSLVQYYLHDVARLELLQPTDLPESFPRLVIGDSDGIATRTPVILVGYPGGNPSTTAGIISNEEVRGAELFQLDVAAYPGSSGGPLILEETEEVIGILVAGRTGPFQGINFAIKVNNID